MVIIVGLINRHMRVFIIDSLIKDYIIDAKSDASKGTYSHVVIELVEYLINCTATININIISHINFHNYM